MRSELIYYLDQDQELKTYLRSHPIWYKKLARHPELVSELKKEADDFNGKSFNKRVEKISQGLGMLNMMIELANMQSEN